MTPIDPYTYIEYGGYPVSRPRLPFLHEFFGGEREQGVHLQ